MAGKLPTVRTLFSAILPNIIQNQQEEAEKILNEYTGEFHRLLNLGQKLAACSNQFLLLKSIGSGGVSIYWARRSNRSCRFGSESMEAWYGFVQKIHCPLKQQCKHILDFPSGGSRHR